jgi:hypothetical protein
MGVLPLAGAVLPSAAENGVVSKAHGGDGGIRGGGDRAPRNKGRAAHLLRRSDPRHGRPGSAGAVVGRGVRREARLGQYSRPHSRPCSTYRDEDHAARRPTRIRSRLPSIRSCSGCPNWPSPAERRPKKRPEGRGRKAARAKRPASTSILVLRSASHGFSARPGKVKGFIPLGRIGALDCRNMWRERNRRRPGLPSMRQSAGRTVPRIPGHRIADLGKRTWLRVSAARTRHEMNWSE